MSPMRPKPQPVTIFPASQPATRPTSNMTTKLSPERFMASFAQSNMPIGRCSHAVVVQQSNWETAQKFHRDQSKGTLRLVNTLKGQSVGAAGPTNAVPLSSSVIRHPQGPTRGEVGSPWHTHG